MKTSRFQLLLVDDDDVYLELVARLLKHDSVLSETVQLTRLEDGPPLLDYLSGRPPYDDRDRWPWPDLVLLDQRMVQLDGTELLRKCRDQGIAASVSICLMTSSEQPKLVREALALGARFCITKPLEFDELQRMLVKIVDFFQTVAQRPAPEIAV